MKLLEMITIAICDDEPVEIAHLASLTRKWAAATEVDVRLLEYANAEGFLFAHKELLYISVSNSFGGEVRKIKQGYLSTKASATHGFGLVRIDKIAEKYKGFVDRQNEDGVFATEIMLPL